MESADSLYSVDESSVATVFREACGEPERGMDEVDAAYARSLSVLERCMA